MVLLLACGRTAPDERAASPPPTFEIEIFPEVAVEVCGEPAAAEVFEEDEDFSGLVDRGWITVARHDYDPERESRACRQQVHVGFPTWDDFYAYAETMSACPQYPFWSAADYCLQTEIFRWAASTGNAVLYRILLRKDGRCVSELNPDLYRILTTNRAAFLRAFGELTPREQIVAIGTLYLRREVEEHSFAAAELAEMEGAEKTVALRFNELMTALGERTLATREVLAGYSAGSLAPRSIALGFGASALRPLLNEDCARLEEIEYTGEMAAPFTFQTQINCFGLEAFGGRRDAELLFSDGPLSHAWVLIGAAEIEEVTALLAREFGPVVYSTELDDVLASGTVAVRNDPPEVLIAGPYLMAALTGYEPTESEP